MNDPQVAPVPDGEGETPQGAEPELSLDPHVMGKTLQPEGEAEPKAGEPSEEKAADSPPAGEDSAEDDTPEEQPDKSQAALRKLAYENRQLRRELESQQQARGPEGDAEPEPLKTLKDFNYDEGAFNAYLIDRAKTEAKAEIRRETAQSNAEQRQQARADEFAAREAAFEADNPGFTERLHAEDLPITAEMAAFITDPDSDVGLHVGDYLASNKAEAARIAALSPTAQAREMTKLEGRIGKQIAKAAAEKTKASTAPKPPKPVDGTDPGMTRSPTDPKSADKMSDAEWLAARNKQLEARRKKQ